MFKTRNYIPVIVAAALVLVLVFIGLLQSDVCAGNWRCWFDVPYKILIGRYVVSENSPTALKLAQDLGKFVLVIGALLSSLHVVLDAARHDVRVALARRRKEHVIVCGLGKTGMQIVRHLHAQGTKVVVVDRADDTADAATCERDGVPVIKGDATNINVLRAAGIERARTVIVCTGDDAINMDVALLVRDTTPKPDDGEPRQTVLAEMRDQWLYARLIDHDRHALGEGHVNLRLFNTYDNAARLLVRSLHLPPGPDIDPGVFVLIGFGSMGQQLLMHIVRAAPAALGAKTRLIVFDRAAEQRKDQLLQAYPALADLAEIEFVTVDISYDTPQVWGTIESTLRGRPLLGAAVCIPGDQSALYAALSLRRHLDDLARVHVPVFVRLELHRHLGEFAGSLTRMGITHDRLKVFGGLEELLRPDVFMEDQLDRLAIGFHNHWLASIPEGQDGGPAAQPWRALAETFKMANRRRGDLVTLQLTQAGLRAVPTKDAPTPLILTDGEVELLARFEHRRWCIDRRLLGYSYAPARSEMPRRHNLLVDWEQLSEDRREGNRADIRKLPEILASVNLEIRRERLIVAAGGSDATAALAELPAEHDGCIVIADIDTAEGRAAAEKAAKLPRVSVWLASGSDIDATPQSVSKGVWETAAGWLSHAQLNRLRA